MISVALLLYPDLRTGTVRLQTLAELVKREANT